MGRRLLLLAGWVLVLSGGCASGADDLHNPARPGSAGAAGTSGQAGSGDGAGGTQTGGGSAAGCGGATAAGGSSGTGGVTGAGGSSGTGGAAGSSGTGGAVRSGGAAGTGGATAAGGSSGAGGRGGAAGSRGSGGSSGAGGRGGAAGSGGSGGATGSGGAAGAGGTAGTGGSTIDAGSLPKFSFFVTSLAALRILSGNQNGFGGDLRFGKADGLSGADEICRRVAERSMPGSGAKGWRAFLSVTKGPNGTAVNAIDRVGNGPWYDRLGRHLAANKTDLAQQRPRGADRTIIDDLPNEDGVLNHNPDGTGPVDNHDMLTGSNAQGNLYNTNWSCTCHDWTSAVGSDGKPRVGHSWPRSGMGRGGDMANWMSALDEAGCAAGVNLQETGGPNPSNRTVGSGGGYGGFYCFALVP